MLHKTKFAFLQSISPGLVEDDIIASGTENEIIKLMPRLKADDVAKVVLFILACPENVLVSIFKVPL